VLAFHQRRVISVGNGRSVSLMFAHAREAKTR
jgi:hypothetical protein